MALTLTIGRNSFKLCHKSGTRTTVWDVSSEDDEATLVAVFRDVLAFVEAPPAPSKQAPPGAYDAQLAMADIVHRQAPATLEPPVLPDRLKGSVELEGEAPAAQPGNGWAGLGGEG
jgi:hypothetical protein